ncbi:hypothetical protein G9A89_017487 [Geosiphon pyriformis]|nr:hypothetical protein G9A89_017487 [Geosiphon pyriformis]
MENALFWGFVKATIGYSIAIIKKAAKASVSGGGFRSILLGKKRRDKVLEGGSGGNNISPKVQKSSSWSSETGEITESESVDMEEECLVAKTSFDYSKGSALAEGNHDQMPTSIRVKTKKALGKPLEKIDFSLNNDDDNVFLDTLLAFLTSIKKLVAVSIRKSFALDIGLDKITEKSSQEKLVVVRKLFSRINGFGGASTLLKFAGIIWATFTSELSLVKTTKMTTDAKILGNTDLRKSSERSDQAVDAVHVAKSDKDKEAWDKRDVHKTLLYTLFVGTNAHNIWDYIKSVGGKTCVIDCYPVSYARARCTTVCFNSADSLNAVLGTTPMLKSANLHWFHLIMTKCAKCRNSGHTSLDRATGGKISSSGPQCKILSDSDKDRLATIYAKCSALVACPVSFGEVKPTLQVFLALNDRFAALECSLTSLAEHVDKLAKRLDTPELTVFQLSPGCQPLVTFSSQNQKADIIMSEGLGVATSGGTVAEAVLFDNSVITKMEKTLRNLLVMVMSLSAKMKNGGSIVTCNVRGMNNSAKQLDIVCWHKDINNLVSVVIETKLKRKFDGVHVFTSGSDSSHMGSGVAIIMDLSLVKHVCKVLEVLSWLLLVKLLFRNRFSVFILGLYAGADKINSLITKAVNESFFIILGGDFNEDRSHKCASFKKCFNLGLVNSLGGSSFAKLPTWCNSCGVAKTIDYMFLSFNLINAIMNHGMLNVDDFFNTDYRAVYVSMDLDGLLDTRLSSICKQANKDCWKFNVKDVNKLRWAEFRDGMAANASMFSDVFHKLELLVSKLVKASCLTSGGNFALLLDTWDKLNSAGASLVKSLFLLVSGFDGIHSELAKTRKSYHSSKMLESKRAEKSHIRQIIEYRMESFELNKGHTIRSVLECLFCKIVLNHLVMDDELVLESELVKSKVDEIMEG